MLLTYLDGCPRKYISKRGSMFPRNFRSTEEAGVSVRGYLFPGFSSLSATVQQLLIGNLNSYARLLCIGRMLVFLVRYAYSYVKELVKTFFSS